MYGVREYVCVCGAECERCAREGDVVLCVFCSAPMFPQPCAEMLGSQVVRRRPVDPDTAGSNPARAANV
jgi:hypothetical protein